MFFAKNRSRKKAANGRKCKKNLVVKNYGVHLHHHFERNCYLQTKIQEDRYRIKLYSLLQIIKKGELYESPKSHRQGVD
jgi:hypothetical protein